MSSKLTLGAGVAALGLAAIAAPALAPVAVLGAIGCAVASGRQSQQEAQAKEHWKLVGAPLRYQQHNLQLIIGTKELESQKRLAEKAIALKEDRIKRNLALMAGTARPAQTVTVPAVPIPAVPAQPASLLSDWGDVAWVPPIAAEPKQPEAIDEADDTAEQVVELLAEFQVPVTHQGIIRGAAINRHKLLPGRGVTVKKVADRSPELKVRLGLLDEPLISAQSGFVAVDIPKERDILYFRNYVQPEKRGNDQPLMMVVGVNLLGELIEVNLSDPDYCHGMVSGKTGAGKTEWIISAIMSLCCRYSPAVFQYVIHTMKPQDFMEPFFQGNPWQWRPVSRDVKTVPGLVSALAKEMRDRGTFLAEHGCKNIDVYNQQHPDKPMPHILFIFDEYGDSMLALGDESKSVEGDVESIARVARAAGIHLYAGDQKPDSRTMDTKVRSNLGFRLCGKVSDAKQSEIGLGMNGLGGEKLLGKGDMLAKMDTVQRIQGLLVEPHELAGKPEWRQQRSPAPQPEPAKSAPQSIDELMEVLNEWIGSLPSPPDRQQVKAKLLEVTGLEFNEDGLNLILQQLGI